VRRKEQRIPLAWSAAAALLAASLAIAGAAHGQGVQSGVLTGTVASSDGVGLPGVNVTATSPTLIGARDAVTGANGDFILRGLPPGTYALSFEMEGMKTVERSVTVALGGTSRADATMEPTAAAETITVTGEGASALETTTIGTNLKKEVVDQLPVSRVPAFTALLAPGVTDNTPLTGQLAIGGGMAYDNAMLINGVNVQDPVFGGSDDLFIEDAIQETQVLTSGISAEYGGFTGGVLNTITKSGGNSFDGGVRADFRKPEWRDETPFENANGIEREGDLSKEYTAVLGGPLVRDRAWFFVAARTQKLNLATSTAVTGQPYINESDNPRYEGKLTWNPTDRHSIQASYIQNNEKLVNDAQNSPIELAAVNPHSEQPNDGFVVNYTGSLSNSLFAELRYSQKAFQFKHAGGTGGDVRNDSPFISYGYVTPVTGTYGAPYFDSTDPEDRDNEEWAASLSYFLTTDSAGSHDAKLGYDRFTVTRTGGNSQSPTSTVLYTDPVVDADGNPVLGADGRIIPMWTPGLSLYANWLPTRGASLDITTDSAFLNDRWQIGSHWALTLGARYEKSQSEATGNITAVDTAGAVVPRLGASWDPKGDGHWKVEGTYAQYIGRYNPSIFGNNSVVGNPLLVYYVYVGPPGAGRDFDPAFDVAGNYVPAGATDPKANVIFEDGVGPAKTTEYSLSLGMQLPRGGFAKASYVTRQSDEFVHSFVNIESGCSEVIVEGVDVGCFDNKVYRNSDLPFRDYEAIQAQVQYRVTDNWLINANATYQIKNDGNFEGEAGQQIGVGAIGTRPEVYPQGRVAPDGRLDDYQKYAVRLWTNYLLDLGRAGSLAIGGIFRYDSGLTFSYGSTFAPTPQMKALNPGYQQLPNFTAFYGARGAGEFDGAYSVDLAFNYSVPVFKQVEPWIKVDIRNLFNFDDPIAYNTTVSAAPGSPRDDFGIPTTFVRSNAFGNPRSSRDFVIPREYRVAVGVRF
jgi:carboxypeptidase family protein/TonB-dependent receptor-like protein